MNIVIMILIYGFIAAISGIATYFYLNRKPKSYEYIHPNYTQKPFDYGGVRTPDFLGYNYNGNRVKFYPYNYVNG